MNAAMIDDLVKSLGRTYPEMISSGMYLLCSFKTTPIVPPCLKGNDHRAF